MTKREEIAQIIDPDAWLPQRLEASAPLYWKTRRHKARKKADVALDVLAEPTEGMVDEFAELNVFWGRPYNTRRH